VTTTKQQKSDDWLRERTVNRFILATGLCIDTYECVSCEDSL